MYKINLQFLKINSVIQVCTIIVILLFIQFSNAQVYPLSDPSNTGNWALQPDFSDEFDNGLDSNKWDSNPNDWGPWSWEPRHTDVSGGNLNLTMDWDMHTRSGQQLYFTSGIIRSKNDIKYGYFEVKMKGAPKHPGVCPAFWTYSINQPIVNYNGQEIKYNEIDFPEIQQRQFNVNLIDWNVIRADGSGVRTSSRVTTGGGIGPSFDPRNEFHVYGCLWEKDNIQFFIDGVLVATADPQASQYQFHPQRLVVSFGLREPYYEYVNGDREPIVTNSRPAGFPTTMQVEYVRVWKDGTLGVADRYSEKNDIKIYPNPIDKNKSNDLHISAPNGSQISVFNVAGVELIKTITTVEPHMLSISDLSTGLYFIAVKSGLKMDVKKLIIN